jgi:RsiW-degrading membrane proteinase PrsW (M82 family)
MCREARAVNGHSAPREFTVIKLGHNAAKATGMKLGMNYTHYDSGQLWVGVFAVAFALIGAILLLPGAAKPSSVVLYILIFGGLFVGVPATLGLGIILAQLKLRKNQHGRKETSD